MAARLCSVSRLHDLGFLAARGTERQLLRALEPEAAQGSGERGAEALGSPLPWRVGRGPPDTCHRNLERPLGGPFGKLF